MPHSCRAGVVRTWQAHDRYHYGVVVWFRPAQCRHFAEVVWINEIPGSFPWCWAGWSGGCRPHDRHHYGVVVWFRPARCSHLAEMVWITEGGGEVIGVGLA